MELKGRGIPCISLNSNLGTEDILWGSDAFKNRVSYLASRRWLAAIISEARSAAGACFKKIQ